MRPYQKDIEQLQEELGHHEYMAKNFRQECNAAFAEYFEKRSIEIQNAIAATKKWQEAAISEWSALTRQNERHFSCRFTMQQKKLLQKYPMQAARSFPGILTIFLQIFSLIL